MIRILALLTTVALASPALADAYIYRDRNGALLLTDNPSKGRGMKLIRRIREPASRGNGKQATGSGTDGGRESGKPATRKVVGYLYTFRRRDGGIHLTDSLASGKGMRLVSRQPVYAEGRPGKPARTHGTPLIASVRKRIETYRPLVVRAARETGLAYNLVHAVILAESAYNPKAVSPKGAMGLMQLMPATAERFGVADPMDPAENIRGGTRYLKWLMERFGNDVELAVAAYNAGEGTVEKYGRSIPPYRETRTYVERVKAYMAQGMLARN